MHTLWQFAIEIFRLTVWLAILVALFAPLEWLFGARPRKGLRDGIASDLGFYFLSSLVPGVLLGAPMAAIALVLNQVIPDDFRAWTAGLPLGVRLAAVLVVGEIGFYWGHRLSHQIPLLWRFHRVHHGAETLDWLINTRAHPVDMVFTRLCGLIPLYALGLAQPLGQSGSLAPILLLLVGTLWGFFIHANLRWRLGPLEWLLSTPHFHHWHHSRIDHIDHNYASMLPWLDRLFGTHHQPRAWPAEYGLAEPIRGGLVTQLIDPFSVPAAVPRPGAAIAPEG